MTAPALLQEAILSGEEIDPRLVEQLRQSFGAGWSAIRDRLRANPPTEDSEAEFEAIGAMGHLILSLIHSVGPELVGKLFGAAFSRGLETVWRSEYAEVSVERKLAMKLTGESIRVLLELLATKFSQVQLPAELPADAMRSVMEEVGSWPKPLRSLYRLEIYCFIAFDLATANETAEFCEWARRAAVAARRADADWRDLSIDNLMHASFGDEGLVMIPAERATAVLDALEQPAAANDDLVALFRDE